MKVILFLIKIILRSCQYLRVRVAGQISSVLFYQVVSCAFKDYGTWRPIESDLSLISAKNKREWVYTNVAQHSENTHHVNGSSIFGLSKKLLAV